LRKIFLVFFFLRDFFSGRFPISLGFRDPSHFTRKTLSPSANVSFYFPLSENLLPLQPFPFSLPPPHLKMLSHPFPLCSLLFWMCHPTTFLSPGVFWWLTHFFFFSLPPRVAFFSPPPLFVRPPPRRFCVFFTAQAPP